MIWKAEEWLGVSNRWHCNCVSKLAGGSSIWYVPARILEISPAALIELMITKYNAEAAFVGTKDDFIIVFTWKNINDMRLWKNFINKKAREKNFCI